MYAHQTKALIKKFKYSQKKLPLTHLVRMRIIQIVQQGVLYACALFRIHPTLCG